MATLAERLERSWTDPTGLWSWLTSVDHKLIGRRYLGTAFFFLTIAGIGALFMRMQLIVPNNTFLGPDTYNGIFTLHGTTMIFLVSTPFGFAFANFLVPLMIGARDMAFPRLNALSWFIFLLAGLLFWSSLLVRAMPEAGWFNYVPLSGPAQSANRGVDFYLTAIVFLTISTTAGAINIITTALKMRAPGMSVRRVPLFVWSMVVTAFAIIFAYPALTAANILLYMDRHYDTLFYNPAAHGDPLLWQHLFWIFGHPDVYIIFLPAVGIISTIVPVFARHRIVAYPLVALAIVTIGVVSFGVWVHHMFAVGIPDLTNSFFAGATILLAIPSSVQFVAWVATIWKGNVSWKSPFLFVFGFFVLFLIGGITGVMFGVIPLDRQTHDTYFVVAHFHYVLVGGAIFPFFAGIHYWWPKFTGRMLNEHWAVLTFWIMFLGFNMLFLPMHILGLLGMPRRVYTYNPDPAWDALNFFQTVGAFVFALGVLFFIINALHSTWGGKEAGPNPWEANTLEWAVSSPPPPYNFAILPVVRTADPLWDPPTPEGEAEPSGLTLAEDKQTPRASILDAEAERVLHMPDDSPLPLLLAIFTLILFLGLLNDNIPAIIVGAVVDIAILIAWTWPSTPSTSPAYPDEEPQP